MITAPHPSDSLKENRELYLDLIKRSLTHSIYMDSEYQSISLKGGVRPLIAKILGTLRLELVRKVNPALRKVGMDWPLSAHTMIGQERLNNLQYCVEKVIQDGVPGDLIETGVWRGGATILMRAIL